MVNRKSGNLHCVLSKAPFIRTSFGFFEQGIRFSPDAVRLFRPVKEVFPLKAPKGSFQIYWRPKCKESLQLKHPGSTFCRLHPSAFQEIMAERPALAHLYPPPSLARAR